jgi:hypothetical protein
MLPWPSNSEGGSRFSASAQLPDGRREGNALDLYQVRSITLPFDLDVIGASLSRAGDIALVTRSPHRVTAIRGAEWEGVCEKRTIASAIVGFAAATTDLQIVDAKTHEVFRWSPSTGCRILGVLSTTDSIVTATIAGDDWIVVGVDREERTTLRIMSPVMRARPPRSVPVPAWFHSDRGRVWAAGSAVIVSTMEYPFSWRAIDSSNPVATTSGAFGSDTLLTNRRDSSAASDLISLAAFKVDSLTLQLLADPRSPLRVWVLYDATGHRVRSTTSRGMIGVLSISSLRREILALRRTDRLELVIYRWRVQT